VSKIAPTGSTLFSAAEPGEGEWLVANAIDAHQPSVKKLLHGIRVSRPFPEQKKNSRNTSVGVSATFLAGAEEIRERTAETAAPDKRRALP
jgi:hypothetical protein